MSTKTDFLDLEMPATGEYPGGWGTVLNLNFSTIDTAIKDLTDSLTEHISSLDAVSVGLNIDLSADINTETELPSINVQYEGLNAEYLGGFKWDEYARSGGSEISISGGQINLSTIGGLNTGEANIVTVNQYGRITSASKVNTAAALGITDVVTIPSANVLYYSKTEIGTILDTWGDDKFAVKEKEHDEEHTHDEYALVNGSDTNKFETPSLSEEIGSDNIYVMNKAQLDNRYVIKKTVTGQSEDVVTGNVKHTGELRYDPNDDIGGGADIADYIVVNKIELDNAISALNIDTLAIKAVADADYHPKSGGDAPYEAINVPDPGENDDAAVPLSKLISAVAASVAAHVTVGHPQYDSISVPDINTSSNIRNCVLQAPRDNTGTFNWYNINGLAMQVSCPSTDTNGDLEQALYATCSDGIAALGGCDAIFKVDSTWNYEAGVTEEEGINLLTFPPNSEGYFGLRKDNHDDEGAWFYIERDITVEDAWQFQQKYEPVAWSPDDYWFNRDTMQLYRWEEYDPDGDPGVYAWIKKLMIPIGKWQTDESTVTLTLFETKIEQQ